MDDIVATAPPTGPSDPRQNGHRHTLVVDELGTFDPRLAPRPAGFDPMLDHPDLHAAAAASIDPAQAWIDAQTEQITPYDNPIDAHTIAAQNQELDAELRGLTEADPRSCPHWCSYADADVHGDEFDTDPDNAEHRGIPHLVDVRHGGLAEDRPGPAEIEAQLEQDRDRISGPIVAFRLIVGQAEQTARLTPVEARTLHQALGELLDRVDN